MSGTAYWSGPVFAERLRAFVTDAVGEPHRLEEVRRRAWSTVWRAETPAGVVFAKENSPGQAHEAATLRAIGEAVPGAVPEVLAHDESSGLFLTPDHGATLAEAGEVTIADWCRLVRDAAVLARALLPARSRLGLTVLDPAHAEAYVATLADQLALLPPTDPARLDAGDRRRVDEALPGLRDDVERVVSTGLPLTFDHNDLHAHNVFARPGRSGRLVFFDVGDAVVADPVAALRVPMASVADARGLPTDTPWAVRAAGPLVEAWHEVWSDAIDLATLVEVLPAAFRLAALNRAESWRRSLASMTPAEQAEHGEAVRRWLLQALRPESGR